MDFKGFAAPPLDGAVEMDGDECPECGGLGVIVNSDGATARCKCGIWERKRLERLVARAHIPRRYQSKTLSGFKAPRGDSERKRIREAAGGYAVGFKPEEKGLLLVGPAGCGKTHIAVGILREVLGRGFSGVYCNVTDLLTRLRDSYSEESADREAMILEEAGSSDLLVLDDLGAEMPTNWVRDRVYLIINRRYESNRTVIITTNCDDAEMKERLGVRITSRLYEMCDRFVRFPDQDWRREQLRDR